MICPSCKVETRIQEVKTEYIYPNLFFGMPTFWGFMNTTVAKLVTVIIAVLGVIMGVIGVSRILNGSIMLGTGILIIFAITIYTVTVCIISLDKYRIKKYFRCLSCRLDWYEFVDEKE